MSEEYAMKLPEIKLMTYEELDTEIERLKHRVLDAKNVLFTIDNEMFDVIMEYANLWT